MPSEKIKFETTEQVLDYVLNKQFEMVGEKYDRSKTTEPDWFLKHTWSAETEKEFIQWLIEESTNNLNLRKKLFKFGSNNKKMIKRGCEFFVFNYGWKIDG